MSRLEQARRLQALQKIAMAKRDAELGRLSAIAVRLSQAETARQDLDAAIAREVDFANTAGEMLVFRALDAHLLLTERAKAALEGRIAAIMAEKEAARQTAALAFGKATVLDEMLDRVGAESRSID